MGFRVLTQLWRKALHNYDVSLKVNGTEIKLSGFPRDSVANSLAGAATSLRGVDAVKSLDLSLKFGKVKLAVNETKVPIIQFPNLILANTLAGMLATLEGVEGEVKTVDLKIKSATKQTSP
jgi:hypothetical protein